MYYTYDGRACRGWMHSVYYTVVTVTKKLCRLDTKMVAMATSLERSQSNFTAVICAGKATKPESRAKIGRIHWNNWARTSSKIQKQFQQLGSFKVIENGAVRQITYDFLFAFQGSSMRISCRFADIAWQKIGVDSVNNQKLSYRRGTHDALCQLKSCQLPRNIL